MLQQFGFAIDLTKLGQLSYVDGSALPLLLREFPLSTLVSQLFPRHPQGLFLPFTALQKCHHSLQLPKIHCFLKLTSGIAHFWGCLTINVALSFSSCYQTWWLWNLLIIASILSTASSLFNLLQHIFGSRFCSAPRKGHISFSSPKLASHLRFHVNLEQWKFYIVFQFKDFLPILVSHSGTLPSSVYSSFVHCCFVSEMFKEMTLSSAIKAFLLQQFQGFSRLLCVSALSTKRLECILISNVLPVLST